MGSGHILVGPLIISSHGSQKGRSGKEKGTTIYSTPGSYLPGISLVFILTSLYPSRKGKETGVLYTLLYSSDKVVNNGHK